MRRAWLLILLIFFLLSKGYTETSRTAEEWFQEGRKACQIEAYYLAVVLFQKALNICPEDELIFNNMGLAYAKMKDYDSALECYNKAIEINPYNPTVYYNMGRVFYFKGNTEKEMEYYQKAIEVDPEFALAYYNMEIIYYNWGDTEKENECSQKILEISVDYALDFYNQGEIFSRKGWNSMASDNFFQAGLIYIEQDDSLKALQTIEVMDTLITNSELSDSLKVKYNTQFRNSK